MFGSYLKGCFNMSDMKLYSVIFADNHIWWKALQSRSSCIWRLNNSGSDKLVVGAELKLRTLSPKQFNHSHQSKGCSWKWKVTWREPDDWTHNHYTSIHHISQKLGHWGRTWSVNTLPFSFSTSSILSQVAWSVIIYQPTLSFHLSFYTQQSCTFRWSW